LQVDACLLEDGGREASSLRQEVEQQMLRIDLGVAPIGCVLLRGDQGFARLCGESIESHCPAS